MPEELYATGGLIAPIDVYRDLLHPRHDDVIPKFPPHSIWTRRGRLLNWLFWWDEGWGFPLRVWGPPPRLRDYIPAFRTVRGGIRFHQSPDLTSHD